MLQTAPQYRINGIKNHYCGIYMQYKTSDVIVLREKKDFKCVNKIFSHQSSQNNIQSQKAERDKPLKIPFYSILWTSWALLLKMSGWHDSRQLLVKVMETQKKLWKPCSSEKLKALMDTQGD